MPLSGTACKVTCGRGQPIKKIQTAHPRQFSPMLRRLRSIAALVAVTATKSTHQQRPQQAWRCLSTTTTRSSSVDLVATGVAVLQAADPMHKVELTRHLAHQLQVDRGGCNAGDSRVTSPQLATTTLLPSPDYRQWKAVAARMPQQPARPAEPRLVEPKAMKRPRGVPLAVYLLHSVAHIELNAIGTHSVTACSCCCSCVCILTHTWSQHKQTCFGILLFDSTMVWHQSHR